MKKTTLLLALTILLFSCTKNNLQDPPPGQIIGDNIQSTEIVDLSVDFAGLNAATTEWNYAQTIKTTYTNTPVITYMTPSFFTAGKYRVRNVLWDKEEITIAVARDVNSTSKFFKLETETGSLHYSFNVNTQTKEITNLRGEETSALFRCIKTAYKYCFTSGQKPCALMCSMASLASLAGCGVGFSIGCVFAWMSLV